MDTPDYLPRPAMRKSLPAREPAHSAPGGSIAVAMLAAQGVGRLATLFSRLAWRATSDLTRTGFARAVSHITVLGVTAGALALGAGAMSGVPEVAGNVALRVAAARTAPSANLPLFAGGGIIVYQNQSGIVRQADPYTIIPNRPRRGVIEYTVEPGDALFSIAGRFGVSPESILWNNQDVLDNDPHKILPGTVLQIPPISGIIHTIQEGDTLESIAAAYKVTVEAIVLDGAPWNNLLEGRLPPAGSALIVPGGQREFKGWELPKITRASSGAGAPALGACAEVSGGLAGSGAFIWPNNSHWISGYNYSAWHPGIDLAGRPGDPVYASDSGFIVYAGWSPVGYGNLIVVDHGNGWQTWYAHLSLIYVTCGQNVWQGGTIGAVGSTGNSSGPHLHFEARYQGDLPNPFNVLPPP